MFAVAFAAIRAWGRAHHLARPGIADDVCWFVLILNDFINAFGLAFRFQHRLQMGSARDVKVARYRAASAPPRLLPRFYTPRTAADRNKKILYTNQFLIEFGALYAKICEKSVVDLHSVKDAKCATCRNIAKA
jgi:hypothetical protein